jgi:hypothetical protein
MKWLLIAGALMIGLLLYFCAPAQSPAKQSEVVTIPLDRIWAYDMPGTQDVRDLEPDKFGEHTKWLTSEEQAKLERESMTDQIRIALPCLRGDRGEHAKPGFAVLGTGAEALQGAYGGLVKGEKPDESFPSVSNVTIVFYAHLCGEYVHIEHIERKGSTVEIQYNFVPHMSQIMSWHVALIPLGKLNCGTYEVKFVQLPKPKAPGVRQTGLEPDEVVNRVVCRPFSFSVFDL